MENILQVLDDDNYDFPQEFVQRTGNLKLKKPPIAWEVVEQATRSALQRKPRDPANYWDEEEEDILSKNFDEEILNQAWRDYMQ